MLIYCYLRDVKLNQLVCHLRGTGCGGFDMSNVKVGSAMYVDGVWGNSTDPKKTWWDCVKADMQNFGLSCEDGQDRKNGGGELELTG